jgi:hypothetical protein
MGQYALTNSKAIRRFPTGSTAICPIYRIDGEASSRKASEPSLPAVGRRSKVLTGVCVAMHKNNRI